MKTLLRLCRGAFWLVMIAAVVLFLLGWPLWLFLPMCGIVVCTIR